MADGVRVTFAPSGAEALVVGGETLLEAARIAGVILPAPCGGRGACGRCAVILESGKLAEASNTEIRALARAGADSGRFRLACMARVEGSVTVRPAVSPERHHGVGGGITGRADRVTAGIDLGTTSVGALLVDPSAARTLGSARVSNRQSSFGADVLSRVAAAMAGSAHELQEAAVSSVLEALESAAAASGFAIADASIERVALAGNTAMVSLIVGASVDGLASHPFRHELDGVRVVANGPLGEALPGTEIIVVPPVAAFVGGDLVAGLIAEGLAEGSSNVIYMDLGTNAEIAAVARDFIAATSASAGPAFEGWGITCGGLSGAGGVVRFAADEETGLHPMTDSGSPTHLTGSGLISVLALLHRLGHLRADGALISEGPAHSRFFEAQGVLAVSLAPDPLDRSLFVTQLDVRQVQSAKAAVRVATKRVFQESGIIVSNLSDVVVTGAFGGALDPADLLTLGVLPSQASECVRLAADAALKGAAAIALDPSMIDIAAGLAGRVRHVDLAAGDTFAEEFLAATPFEPYEL